MAKVELRRLTKAFVERAGPGHTAVHGIDLEINDGEFMVLVGPSGCGKSTTLRMIAGLEEASSGNILIDGQDVSQLEPKERDVGMVFQNYALYPHMTVFENMAFGLRLRGVGKTEVGQRVRSVAQSLGLEALLERKPRALSGGQRQRVALGRVIVREPKVFLFDEPLSNLDAQMRQTTRAELARLHAALRATMIYVTHDQVEAMTLGDRICVMNEGRIQQVATPEEIYQRPANLFVASFIGSPAMNFLQGVIIEAKGRLWFEETNPAGVPLKLAVDEELRLAAISALGRPVILGVRPEALHEAISDHPEGESGFAATIELAELLGAETYLHFNTGAHRLIARLRPSARFQPGRTLLLGVESGGALLFDPVTGSRLGRESRGPVA